MKSVELAKAYNPKDFEDRIYEEWQRNAAFQPRTENNAVPYVVVIPPPNVTGVLHLGHGLNISLQDIVVRFHRMRGVPTLWVPGTDHAGIATQNVVERRLRERGESRHTLGREQFIAETWQVKEEHHRTISKQLARMGASVDWTRERFTMDEGLSKAVREVFVALYERDLLYKGNYLVNWCASCGTALSDDEVEYEDTPGVLYYIRYPFADGSGYIPIATTRPETLLGDTAVAVHPEDPRYQGLIGKELALPLTERRIPLIGDTYVDRDFGTGALKITPAHDANDWDLGARHELPAINILNPDGTLNQEVPEKYRGMAIGAAREAVVADLKAASLLIREEAITHGVGHCYRCNTTIEPYLSDQWFVRMKPLAEKGLESWRRGEFIFYPKKWENTFQHWMNTIRDWCISRQLWWGHRIPAWTCSACGELSVSRVDLTECPSCHSRDIQQDPDVLDTWFSSWLWPFSVMGWPEGIGASGGAPSGDFARFYPTTALLTAYDIIFFWVARMIMAGLEFTGKAPFRDIYIHGLIRDKQGRKMSKSLGNGLDPLELVDEFGADALKFTLAFMCAQGQDLFIDKESFKLGSKFANKIWNASRYILMNLEGRSRVENPPALPADRWISSRLNTAAHTISDALLSYRYNDAAVSAYEYFWNDFCDWYVEATKLSLREGDDAEKDRAATLLLLVLEESLRLLHPLLPFITEEIYGKIPADFKDPQAPLLITAPYPEYSQEREDKKAEDDFTFIQNLVKMVRTLRSECTVSPDIKIPVTVRLRSNRDAFLRENASVVMLLAGISDLALVSQESTDFAKPVGSIGLVGSGFEAFVSISQAVDLQFLRDKFTKELTRDRKYIEILEHKLENEQFLQNAPPELVAGEKEKLVEAMQRVLTLDSYIRDMA